VVFEEYDFPGLTTVNGIASIEGNYPSKGSGERGAWFRDGEGNMLGIWAAAVGLVDGDVMTLKLPARRHSGRV
jgi:hypothetical protein